MRIFYHLSGYVSHARAGSDNIEALRGIGHEIVDDPARADVAVLHDDPVHLGEIMERTRHLYRIGYCVFEMDRLPEVYAAALEGIDEIWTCSAFSREVFASRFPNVHVVPHVVRRPRITQADAAGMRELVGEGGPTFYTIADSMNLRKNLPGLLAVFAAVRERTRARLVVKQYRMPIDALASMEGVVSIDEKLTDGEIGALHSLCDCYVSAHRCEAWGLGLSEAMAFGKPVVATGYSGNMEFMDTANSYPVAYNRTLVTDDDLRFLPPMFEAGMGWAEPDLSDMADKMVRAMSGRDAGLCDQARQVAERFSIKAVGAVMGARLERLAG